MKRARPELPKRKILKTVFMVILMLVWVLVAVFLSQLAVGKIMVAILGADVFLQTANTALYSALSYLLAMALIIIVPKIITKKRMSLKELGMNDWPTWTDILLTPIGYIIYLLIAAGLMAIFAFFPWFNATETQELVFESSIVGGERFLAFVTLVVIAPIAEEIIFRGWLYGRLRERTGRVLAILLTSALFGAVHLQWNVGVNVFALSLILCLLREITGSINAGILLHILKNGIAFYLLFVLGVG